MSYFTTSGINTIVFLCSLPGWTVVLFVELTVKVMSKDNIGIGKAGRKSVLLTFLLSVDHGGVVLRSNYIAPVLFCYIRYQNWYQGWFGLPNDPKSKWYLGNQYAAFWPSIAEV